jgi:hypothetical protein
MNIGNQTELELIQAILALYSPDEQMTWTIAHHIATKLQMRRRLIRERRKSPACQQIPSKPAANAESP